MEVLGSSAEIARLRRENGLRWRNEEVGAVVLLSCDVILRLCTDLVGLYD